MIVSELPAGELAQRLAGAGLRLRTGPVVSEVRSTLPEIARGIGLYYTQHPVEEANGFVDFHVHLSRPWGLRRWFRPQVNFELDGLPPFLPLSSNQAFPMLEWGLNWCIHSHLHQHLVIHAAVLERNGRALILPAPPGSGKSTLCAALSTSGWRLMSDELTIIELATGQVVGLARPISLKNASIDVIKAFAPEAFVGPAVHDTLKGSVAYMRPPLESVQRVEERATPAWIVLPRYIAGAPLTFTHLSKAHAFMRLADNAFNPSLHGRRGFDVLAGVLDACECSEFSYGHLDEAMTAFDRLARGG